MNGTKIIVNNAKCSKLEHLSIFFMKATKLSQCFVPRQGFCKKNVADQGFRAKLLVPQVLVMGDGQIEICTRNVLDDPMINMIKWRLSCSMGVLFNSKINSISALCFELHNRSEFSILIQHVKSYDKAFRN